MKIDTHIHSTYSDGTSSVKEIVKDAKSKNLALISLTDHNTFNGIEDLRKYSKENGVRAIAGIEISTTYFGEDVHVLGYYNINTNFNDSRYDIVKDCYKVYVNGKKEQLKKIVENISKDENVSVDEFEEFVTANATSSNINRVIVAKYLVSKKIVSSINEAFDKFINTKSKYYVEIPQANAMDAIRAIVISGGIPVVAHLGLDKFSDDNDMLTKFFDEISLITNSVGIELFHFNHDDSKIDQLIEFTKNYKDLEFFFSAGSDYHGLNKSNEIGTPWEDVSEKHKNLYEEISRDFINLLEDKGYLERA